MSLNREPNIADPDAFYEELIACQRDLSDEQALLFQAKLLLFLANHVGDRAVLSEAMRAAQKGCWPRMNGSEDIDQKRAV